ncbi:MAG: hypothetical protein HQM10_13715 [Candidatus Riflebacteria bacterium]|nr:hypothetical protein [Candidatus Riflebacteria bacterium]
MKLFKIFLLIAFTGFLAHFFYFCDFGFYEDDYAFISTSLNYPASQLLRKLNACFFYWPQGRPLGFFLPTFFTVIGSSMGDLKFVYFTGFLIIFANSLMFYLILCRIKPKSTLFAVTGMLAFLLFPADTTKPFLLHLFQLQPSLSFLLLGYLLYLSGWTRFSYFCVTLTLLTYESFFMLFLAAPVIRCFADSEKKDPLFQAKTVSKSRFDEMFCKYFRVSLNDFLFHSLIMAAIILCVVVIREFTGDSRLEGSGNPFQMVNKIFFGSIIGPLSSLFSFFLAIYHVAFSFQKDTLLICFILFCVFLPIFIRIQLPDKCEKSLENRSGSLLPASVLLLVSSYLFSFTHFPPSELSGRGTSVHLAATFSVSFFIALLVEMVKNNRKNTRLFSVFLAAFFSMLGGYHFIIQKDYIRSWQNQKKFWSEILETCSDISDGTVIFVIKDRLPQTKYILTNSWADPIVLCQLLKFPRNWKKTPKLNLVEKDWADTVVFDKGEFFWKVPETTWLAHWDTIPDSNFILLEESDGKICRKEGSIKISGRNLQLKNKAKATIPEIDKGLLYRLMIQ